jgi:NADPH:quinone reductase-like Zn-dependent oxidoreductase
VGEALVRVHAAAITRDELEWPVDRLPAIPSYELSGVVAALGQGVESLAIGEPVYALIGFDRDGAAADEVLDGAVADLADAVQPVDLVFDTVGGERLERSPTIVRDGGRLASVAEEPPERVSRASIEARYFVVEPDSGQLVELGRMLDRGELRVAIDSVFPLEDARAAFERSLATGKRGKVVLRVAGDETAA